MDDHKLDTVPSAPHDHGEGDRRLARGLEDVSHLFFSQAAREASSGGEAHAAGAEQVPGDVLRPVSAVNRPRLASLLEEHIAALEEGLRSIDAGVPCDPYGAIDVLAVDNSNRLVAVDLVASSGDELLLRGICHVDWLVRGVPLLRRMYRGRVINYSLSPRLFLVAPEFSARLGCVTRWVSGMEINYFRYHTVALRSGVGILFERVVPSSVGSEDSIDH